MKGWRFPRQELRLDYREMRDGFHVEEKAIRVTSCHAAPEWAYCAEVLRALFANPLSERTKIRARIFYLYFRCGFTAEHVAAECVTTIDAVDCSTRRMSETAEKLYSQLNQQQARDLTVFRSNSEGPREGKTKENRTHWRR